MVGQRFVQLLVDHPWFKLEALTASERSAGKLYAEAAKWYLHPPMPDGVKDVEVRPTAERSVENAKIVFSALPADIAREVEPAMAEAGHIVASNASAFRMEEDVPLMIPEVNPDHLALIDVQRDRRRWDGLIVTNPNCTTIILVLALKPILDEYGIKRAFVATMQALSGAGYGGVRSMTIQDNIIPFIAKEEAKTETESLKILGKLQKKKVMQAQIEISASCHRVPVLDGHTEAVFLEMEMQAPARRVAGVLANFKAKPQRLKLPTAPKRPIIVEEGEDRPQPRFARSAGSVPGMAVVVGRVREDPVFKKGIKFLVSGNNAIRGAAGASVLNAELMKAEGYLK
jgi:aspartate-semialdehyde dehydrogenase